MGVDEIIDITALLAVPSILLVVHQSFTIQQQYSLVFFVQQPTLISAFTSSFVHLSIDHLFVNLIGYAFGAVVAYLLCRRYGCRTWFRRTFALLLFLLPLFTSGVTITYFNVLASDSRVVTYGFSSIVAGFLGFLIVILWSMVRKRFDGEAAAHAVTFVTSSVVLILITRYSYRLYLPLLSVAGFGLCFSSVRLVSRRGESISPDVVLIVLVGGFCIGFANILFPPTSITANTNVYAHAAGAGGGAVLAESVRRATVES